MKIAELNSLVVNAQKDFSLLIIENITKYSAIKRNHDLLEVSFKVNDKEETLWVGNIACFMGSSDTSKLSIDLSIQTILVGYIHNQYAKNEKATAFSI